MCTLKIFEYQYNAIYRYLNGSIEALIISMSIMKIFTEKNAPILMLLQCTLWMIYEFMNEWNYSKPIENLVLGYS